MTCASVPHGGFGVHWYSSAFSPSAYYAVLKRTGAFMANEVLTASELSIAVSARADVHAWSHGFGVVVCWGELSDVGVQTTGIGAQLQMRLCIAVGP